MEIINENDEMRKKFGKRLKRLREDRELTLQELVDKLKLTFDITVTFGSLGNYERGYRLPRPILLNKLASFYDVTTDYLLGLTDVKNAKIVQTTLFDKENNPHTVKVGINKDSDLANMPFNEIAGLIEKLKELGFDFNKK